MNRAANIHRIAITYKKSLLPGKDGSSLKQQDELFPIALIKKTCLPRSYSANGIFQKAIVVPSVERNLNVKLKLVI